MQDLNIKIRWIPYGTDEYKSALKFRDRVLRRPLGLNIGKDDWAGDESDCHLGAFKEDRLVGTLTITRLSGNEVKFRQVAVDEMLRRRRIGTRLIEFALDFSKKQGFQKASLDARKTTVPFYESVGFKTSGGEFIECTLPHCRMYKAL